MKKLLLAVLVLLLQACSLSNFPGEMQPGKEPPPQKEPILFERVGGSYQALGVPIVFKNSIIFSAITDGRAHLVIDGVDQTESFASIEQLTSYGDSYAFVYSNKENEWFVRFGEKNFGPYGGYYAPRLHVSKKDPTRLIFEDYNFTPSELKELNERMSAGGPGSGKSDIMTAAVVLDGTERVPYSEQVVNEWLSDSTTENLTTAYGERVTYKDKVAFVTTEIETGFIGFYDQHRIVATRKNGEQAWGFVSWGSFYILNDNLYFSACPMNANSTVTCEDEAGLFRMVDGSRKPGV